MRFKGLTIVGILLVAQAVYGETETKTLETPHYVVTITQRCEEYVVGCDHVTYHGLSRKSGNAIDLKGEQDMHMCADGVTPCHLNGWRFKRGATEYYVSVDGNLEIKQGAKTIAQEQGKWKE
jgi:hypothetical protein